MGSVALDIPAGFRFYKDAILTAAQKWNLDPVLVAAVVWQESSFNTFAYRFEPDFWNRYLKGNPKFASLNPARVSASYGLMQVMYCRVFEDQRPDDDAWEPELLFLPENGLDIGCGLLRDLLDWAGTKTTDKSQQTNAALASYNGGRGGNDPSKDNPLRNGVYARQVLNRYPTLQKAFV